MREARSMPTTAAATTTTTTTTTTATTTTTTTTTTTATTTTTTTTTTTHREKMRDARSMRASFSRRSSRIILMILSVPGVGPGLGFDGLDVPALSPKGELPVVSLAKTWLGVGLGWKGLISRAKTSTESKGRMEMRSMANLVRVRVRVRA
eukprot:scaffold95452_cov49-Phaeocystis_antarctica.AAC.2